MLAIIVIGYGVGEVTLAVGVNVYSFLKLGPVGFINTSGSGILAMVIIGVSGYDLWLVFFKLPRWVGNKLFNKKIEGTQTL
jgi:hypothetical protein